ncbi:MAG: DUF2520 domain-containing protein [Ignavibacteriae bacterium]|nr:DUF2520 domain-containing protein [Ignavibacteriota bacterium]
MTGIKKYLNKKICLVGLGKVGSALYHALINSGLPVSSVVEKNTRQGKRIISGRNDVAFRKNITGKILKECDVIIYSVQEKNLKDAVGELKKYKKILNDKILLHTSGVETSELFESVSSRKALNGSFHPLQTFNHISYNNNNLLNNIYFGIEGGSVAVKYAKIICSVLECRHIVIPKSKKTFYHSLCVIASNFLVTHYNILGRLSEELSPDKKSGIEIFEAIIRTTTDNVFIHGTQKSLTGPFARGDIKTIQKHLEYMRENIPNHLYYYVLHGLEALSLSVKEKKIERKTAEQIEKLLIKFI